MMLIALMVMGANAPPMAPVPLRVAEMPMVAPQPPRPPRRVQRPGRPRFAQRRLVPPQGEGTPIVLSFTGAPVAYTAGTGAFAFEPGTKVASAWPTAVTPWLARDLDGDGRITSGRELFGSFTEVAGQGLAANGFEALAVLDANHDGLLDARDPAFDELLLWSDENADRISQPNEITKLSAAKVTSLSLRYEDQPRCDAHGTCERERAVFHFTDASGADHQGAAIDLHFVLPRAPALACHRRPTVLVRNRPG